MTTNSFYREIIDMAGNAMNNAYAPYSGFKVGAAVLTDGGKIYTGCNVENASYGACICAERVALCRAVSEGERNFKAVAIVSSSGRHTYPCGICRQSLAEFSEDMDVVSEEKGCIQIVKIDELLPHRFSQTDPEVVSSERGMTEKRDKI